ncbi:MAG: hypothetical protein KGI70_02490 [Patescibacteria group bacterium]|nr:hypothetical protein [Patescibacteria group bacterium]
MDTIFTDGQLTKAMETMRQKGMNPERFNRLLSSGIFADICDPNACLDDRDSVRKALKLGVALPESITFSVDYGRSLDQMVAAGNYDWKNDNITAKKFSVVGNGIEQFEVKVFHFDRTMSSEAAVEAIKAAGFEPGKIEHLLSFGEKYPEEQRKYPITALGSVARVGGYRHVPYLYRYDAERRLGLFWWVNGWNGRCRFLAVRKLSSAPQA